MKITGGIVTPCSPLYHEARNDFNIAFDKFPCLVVFCYRDCDVQNALRYAVEEKIPFRIRSGRHDYEANSSLDDGMIIDMSNINYTQINECCSTAKLGGGITSGKMYGDLLKAGYTCPSGVCSDVGYCSLSSCGGVGFLSRLYGLACDNLLEIEIINYKGEMLIANTCENSDLFWAIRGGLAGNFGVVISMTFRIHKVECASVYTITWNPEFFVEVVDRWQRYTPTADRRLSTNIRYVKDIHGNIALTSSGQFMGSSEELKYLIQPLIDAAPPCSVEIQTLPYNEVIQKWSGNCPGPQKFKASGSFCYCPIPCYMLEKLKNFMYSAPPGAKQFYEFIGLGGKVSDIPSYETAFVHRPSLFLLEMESVWTKDYQAHDNILWVNTIKKDIDTVGVGSYRGFTDFNLPNWAEQYYGENYARLRYVKNMYDPYNIFRFPQSIKP